MERKIEVSGTGREQRGQNGWRERRERLKRKSIMGERKLETFLTIIRF